MRYLIVDDEALVLRDEERTLREVVSEQDVILTADYYEDALAYAEEDKINVAFLDIEMPEMSGLELAKRLKELQPDMNIVFVTAYSDYMKEAWNMYVSGYLLKLVQKSDIEKALMNLRFTKEVQEEKLEIQCFGNFECFYKGRPIKFERGKSKEFFACLVEAKGAKVRTNEIRAKLFEEEEDSVKKKSYIRTLASDIRKTLKRFGLSDVLLHERDYYYLDLAMIDCDYFRYLKGDAIAVNQYQGVFMKQYSWAEMTVGSLENRM